MFSKCNICVVHGFLIQFSETSALGGPSKMLLETNFLRLMLKNRIIVLPWTSPCDRLVLGDLPPCDQHALQGRWLYGSADSGDRACRSAIEDTRSNDTELEVVIEPDCKWLMNILDQSSSQWGGRCYLSYTAGLRFLHVADMFHRRSNDCKNALSQVGLNSLRLTASICINFRMGPWQESAHHHKMVGILSDYCRTRTVDDPLFIL
eukprot:6491027-Amphidinium_carterae.1